MKQQATVLYGRGSLFGLLLSDGTRLESPIKGKVLKGVDDYNPLAAGDWVIIDDNAQITARVPRHNCVQRFNWKLKKPQTFFANVDAVLCVVATQGPPLHPRFVDRLLVACETQNIPAHIVLNKVDKGISAEQQELLTFYAQLGYGVWPVCAHTGAGLAELATALTTQTVGLLGASGVGKSTLLNRLEPSAQQLTGEVNRKWDRGNHTTNFATFLTKTGGGYWVDTPGMRDFTPHLAGDLMVCFPDLEKYASDCAFNNCKHLHEPSCAVLAAVEAGVINDSRYESYAKLLEELKPTQQRW